MVHDALVMKRLAHPLVAKLSEDDAITRRAKRGQRLTRLCLQLKATKTPQEEAKAVEALMHEFYHGMISKSQDR